MILIVEDNRVNAKTIERQFKENFPSLQISFVADGENAINAIIGEPFKELDPKSYTLREREGKKFSAVVWDNTFPRKWGETAVSDEGLNTVKSLFTSGKVEAVTLSRFVSLSSDNPIPLRESGFYADVFEKPFGTAHITRLGELFKKWGLLK